MRIVAAARVHLLRRAREERHYPGDQVRRDPHIANDNSEKADAVTRHYTQLRR